MQNHRRRPMPVPRPPAVPLRSRALPLALAVGLSLGLVGGPADAALAAVPEPAVAAPAPVTSAEPFLRNDVPVTLDFTEEKTRYGFRMRVPARAHLTFHVTASTVTGMIYLNIQDPDPDVPTMHSMLSTGTGPGQYSYEEVSPAPVPRIMYVGFSSINGMPYSLQVTPKIVTDAPPARISFATATTASTSQAGEVRRFAFSGAPGHSVAVRATGNTFPSLASRWEDDYALRVVAPDGTRTALRRVSTNMKSAAFGPLPVSAGRHLLELDPGWTSTGSVTLELFDVPPAAGPAPLAVGQPTAVTVSPFTVKSYTVQVDGDEQYDVSVRDATATGISTVSRAQISVVPPEGGEPIASLSVGSDLPADLAVIKTLGLPGGTYRIVVDPVHDAAATLTLSVTKVTGTTAVLVPGSPVTASSTTPGRSLVFTSPGGTSTEPPVVQLTGTLAGQSAVASARLEAGPSGAPLGTSTSILNGSYLGGTTTLTVPPSTVDPTKPWRLVVSLDSGSTATVTATLLPAPTP